MTNGHTYLVSLWTSGLASGHPAAMHDSPNHFMDYAPSAGWVHSVCVYKLLNQPTGQQMFKLESPPGVRGYLADISVTEVRPDYPAPRCKDK